MATDAPAPDPSGPPAPTPPIQDASTVLLVRDRAAAGSEAAAAVEVFMVERRKAGAFAGLLAFPGGKVDDTDRHLPPARWTGLDLDASVAAANAAVALGPVPAEDDRPRRVVTPADELGWMVAAVREVFEEVGVLLAHRARPATPVTPVTSEDLATASFTEARARLVARGEPWDWTDWLAGEDLVLDLGALGPWSWWVTPVLEPRRFDTRFFVAAMPPAQADAIGHDEVETVSSRWCTVAEVEAERAAGTSAVIYPTRRNLHPLEGFSNAAAAVDAARSGARDLRPCQPVLVEVAGGPRAGGGLVAHHPWDGTVEDVL